LTNEQPLFDLEGMIRKWLREHLPQQTEATKSQPQETPPNKNEMRVDESPMKRTRNAERYVV